MTLSSSNYLTLNVPYARLLPEYRLQLHVLLPPEDDPTFLECCVLSEHLPQFDFRDFPHHPLERNTPTILDGPTGRNPVDLNQVSVYVRQLVRSTFTYPTTRKLPIRVSSGKETEMYRSAIVREVQFSTNDQWHDGQKERHVGFPRKLCNSSL
jgi:hypothetical protein